MKSKYFSRPLSYIWGGGTSRAIKFPGLGANKDQAFNTSDTILKKTNIAIGFRVLGTLAFNVYTAVCMIVLRVCCSGHHIFLSLSPKLRLGSDDVQSFWHWETSGKHGFVWVITYEDWIFLSRFLAPESRRSSLWYDGGMEAFAGRKTMLVNPFFFCVSLTLPTYLPCIDCIVHAYAFF